MNAPLPSLAQFRRMDDAADAIEAENERMSEQEAPKYIGQSPFWSEELQDTKVGFLADPLAACMADLTAACEGDEFARDRICQALHQIERQAVPVAREQLLGIYERGEG